MRLFRLLLLLALAVTFTSASRADTFDLTYGSTHIAFDLQNGPPSGYFMESGEGVTIFDVPLTSPSGYYIGVYLIDPPFDPDRRDIIVQGGILPGDIAFFIGPVLFGGGPNNTVTYPPGTYDLTGYGNANGVLVIDGGAGGNSATPEPSSLVLLGSGILGLAGDARRRFSRK